ncbi:hypothetical protein IIY24_01075 [Candidatus Saccharibacteria bacterium]|nr:hypothetical protein [Candidatus Saccharibacteria bacterium]
MTCIIIAGTLLFGAFFVTLFRAEWEEDDSIRMIVDLFLVFPLVGALTTVGAFQMGEQIGSIPVKVSIGVLIFYGVVTLVKFVLLCRTDEKAKTQ